MLLFMAELASIMVGLDEVRVQVETTLHDLMDTIRDAPKEFQKLLAEEQAFRQAVLEVLEHDNLGSYTSRRTNCLMWTQCSNVASASHEKCACWFER